jgi:hypothetical protein
MNSYTEVNPELSSKTEETDETNAFHRFIPESLSHSGKAKTPKDVLVVSILCGLLGLSAINSLGLIALIGAYTSLASQKPPTLVQLSDGKAITAIATENKTRSPEVVKQFVTQQVMALMTWTGELPSDASQNGKPFLDTGVEVTADKGLKKKITTTAWQASFAFSEDFRKGLLSSIAELTPTEVFTGGSKVILVPQTITVPEEIEKGKWKVNLVANLVTFSPLNQVGESIPFNKEIFIQAIDVPNLKLDASLLEQAIFKVRSTGLEIYAMRDLTRNDLK